MHDLAQADSKLMLVPAVRQALDFDDRYSARVAKNEVDARASAIAHPRNDPTSREHQR
jgi:hypothetical protein